jgi:hypothetical protein
MKGFYVISAENHERGRLEAQDVDGGIILKLILKN